METNNVHNRQNAKGSEAQLLRVLEQEYALAPRIAQAVIEEVQAYLSPDERGRSVGQKIVNLVRQDAGHGRDLAEVPTVAVAWTVDGGEADQQVLRTQGSAALRRQRIVRLLEEALEQGGLATQEDLAAALGVTVRTIKRDFAQLHGQGEFLPSRGYRQGIGRGQSHKVQIIEQWLKGATYDQIMDRTHHSLPAIQRYIQTFVRIVDLRNQALTASQISFITQIGQALVERYLAIYDAISEESQRQRLQSQVARLTAGRTLAKKRGKA